jgi:hypothetical protein
MATKVILGATHGRGATWWHYSATISLDGSATCDEARSVIAAWLDSDDPDQGEWFCQSSHGAASATVIGACARLDGTASATAEGTFDVAVARQCGRSLKAYAIRCRVARNVKSRATSACAVVRGDRVHMKVGCRVAGYRCRDHRAGPSSSKVRCQHGRRREAAFRL